MPRNYEEYPYSATVTAFVVKKARLARKVNKITRTYPNASIKDGDEALFHVQDHQLKLVRMLLA